MTLLSSCLLPSLHCFSLPPSLLLTMSFYFFPLSVQLMFGRFGQVVEKKKSITLQDISAVSRHLSGLLCVCLSVCSVCVSDCIDLISLCLSSSQEERRQLSSMLGCEISSMLCVPVASRATSQVVALACAFNKQGGQRYVCMSTTVFIL